MHYFSPSRPRLPNGLPAWLSAPNIALPRLILEPVKHGNYCICAMINSSYKYADPAIREISLDKIFQLWILDPEQFAKEYFGVETIHPTTASMIAEILPSVNPADLGI